MLTVSWVVFLTTRETCWAVFHPLLTGLVVERRPEAGQCVDSLVLTHLVRLVTELKGEHPSHHQLFVDVFLWC